MQHERYINKYWSIIIFSSIYIANNGSCLREKKEKSKIIVAATCFIISILLIGPNGEQKQNIVKR